jgi:hypothetical protein
VAAAKLAYCERVILRLGERELEVTDASLDEDVGEIEYSLGHYYRDDPAMLGDLPCNRDIQRRERRRPSWRRPHSSPVSR